MAIVKILKEDSESNPLYDDKKERELHLNAIEMIALRAGASVEDVKRVYEIVLRRFKRSARVKDFLPILVSRRVEYLLDKRKTSKGDALKGR